MEGDWVWLESEKSGRNPMHCCLSSYRFFKHSEYRDGFSVGEFNAMSFAPLPTFVIQVVNPF